MTRRMLAVALLPLLLGACDVVGDDKSVDRGRDNKPVSQLTAGIWIDPDGCDHWIVDDGVEGYLSPRLDRAGRPVCSGTPDRARAVGPYKSGGSSIFGDPL